MLSQSTIKKCTTCKMFEKPGSCSACSNQETNKPSPPGVKTGSSDENPQDDMIHALGQKQDVNQAQGAAKQDKNIESKSQTSQQGQAQVNRNTVFGCEPEEMLQLREILKQRGIPSQNATLIATVISDPVEKDENDELPEQRKFMLEQDDIENIFKRFGDIINVDINQESGQAHILFHDVIDATMAKFYMDNVRLEASKAVLSVEYFKPVTAARPTPAVEEVKQQDEKVQEQTAPLPNQEQQRMMEYQTMMYQNHLQQQQLFFAQQQQQQMMHAQFQAFPYGGAQGAQPFTPGAQPGLGFQPQTMQMPMPAYPHGQFGIGAPIFQPSASPFNIGSQPLPMHQQQQQTQVANQPQPPPFVPSQQPQPFIPNQKINQFKPSTQSPSYQPGSYAPPDYDPYQSEEDQGVKYTCKYEIQITNEREFQVARRVIGSKGANMKRIIEECAAGFDPSVNQYEIVKLRLRGHGSGFKEGPQKEESQDPLNLCISSKYKEKYDYACSEMEILINEVYEDYYKFYQYRKNRPANWDHDLKIKKEETVTRPKPFPEQEDGAAQENGFSAIQASLNQILNNSTSQLGNPNPSQQMNSFQPNQYQIPPYQQTQAPSFFPMSNQSQAFIPGEFRPHNNYQPHNE